MDRGNGHVIKDHLQALLHYLATISAHILHYVMSRAQESAVLYNKNKMHNVWLSCS